MVADISDPTSVAQVFHLGFLPAISKILEPHRCGVHSSLLPFGSCFMLFLLLASRSRGFLDEWTRFDLASDGF